MSKTDKDSISQTASRSAVSRRSFLKGAGAAGLAATQLGLPALEAEQTRPDEAVRLGPDPVPVRFQVNGQPYAARLEPRVTLADALREHLGLSGTKVICDRGACGGCTVLLDNEAVVSCMVLAVAAQGKHIQTVEGLAQGEQGEQAEQAEQAERLDPLQDAFIAHDALQCGYCTPGMLMSCKALLARNPSPSRADIKTAISGNICRCGTYPHVVAAVLAASGQQDEG